MSKLSHVFIAFTLFICEISVKQSRFWGGAYCYLKYFHYLYTQTINLNDMQNVNRLKIVLIEQKKGGSRDIDNIVEGYPSKWLSEKLGVNPSTVSKWCTNSWQLDLEMLARIFKELCVGVEKLYYKKFMDLAAIH